jgi:predicted PurR-regulated permease PerM
VGRFEHAWTNVRRAYEVGRDTVRTARSRAEAANGPAPEEAEPLPEPVVAPPPAAASIDDAVPRSLRIAAAWSWRLIVVAVVGLGLLYLADRYLILVAPLMIGLLLAGLLAPALRLVLAVRLNRSLATLLVLVTGLAVVAGTITLAVNQMIGGLDHMVTSAEEGIADIQEWVQGPPLNMTDADLQNLVDQGAAWVDENTATLTSAGLSAVTGTVQFLTGLVLALVATFFFLRDGRRIWTFLVGTLPVRARAPMAYAGDGAWRTLTGYVRATVLVALIDAVGIGVGLWVLRVPLALPLAALVFLGAFVPIVGAFLSGTVAVLVALVDAPLPGVLNGGGPVKALMVLGLIILVQQIEGNVLHPVIMSRAVQIHPLAVIVAVTAGILLAGIIGALVAVPVVAVMNTVIRRLNSYHRPLAGPGQALPAPGLPGLVTDQHRAGGPVAGPPVAGSPGVGPPGVGPPGAGSAAVRSGSSGA